jgi:hypothetical protein
MVPADVGPFLRDSQNQSAGLKPDFVEASRGTSPLSFGSLISSIEWCFDGTVMIGRWGDGLEVFNVK